MRNITITLLFHRLNVSFHPIRQLSFLVGPSFIGSLFSIYFRSYLGVYCIHLFKIGSDFPLYKVKKGIEMEKKKTYKMSFYCTEQYKIIGLGLFKIASLFL